MKPADHRSPVTPQLPGGYTEGETPDPIPNSEVKPLRADGSDPARDRESRSPPGFLLPVVHHISDQWSVISGQWEIRGHDTEFSGREVLRAGRQPDGCRFLLFEVGMVGVGSGRLLLMCVGGIMDNPFKANAIPSTETDNWTVPGWCPRGRLCQNGGPPEGPGY